MKNIILIWINFLLIYSCTANNTSSNDTIKSKDDMIINIYSGTGILYMKNSKSGKVKGYYEYGNLDNNNYCYSYFEISEDEEKLWKNIFYSDFTDLNEKFEIVNREYIDTGLVQIDSSFILLKKGGGYLCDRFLVYEDALKLDKIESTTDSFIAIIKDDINLYDENVKKIGDLSLYSGMLFRSIGKKGKYYIIQYKNRKILINENDCRLW